MNKKKVLTIGLVLLVVFGSIFLLSASDKPKSTNSSPVNGQELTRVSLVITYTDTGFAKQEAKVTAGSEIRIINESKKLLQFDSDPHPEHTDNSELNVGSIAPGKSVTIKVTKTGRHGYHNHLDSSHMGEIVVE